MRVKTSKLYSSLDASIALSRFFLPTKHHGHTVSELTSIWMSFFEAVLLADSAIWEIFLTNFSHNSESNLRILTHKLNQTKTETWFSVSDNKGSWSKIHFVLSQNPRLGSELTIQESTKTHKLKKNKTETWSSISENRVNV